MGGKIEIVKILIDAGADVNAKDNDGCTALWWALDEETARILRAAGGIE
jgi:ankyrin repeat protein